jgi:hypothetical protein
MWILESILEEVYTAYEALPGGRTPLPRDDHGRIPMGSKEKARNQDYRVIWMLQTGNFGSATLAGAGPPPGPDAPPEQATPHYQALARFWVWIWECDQEAAWNVMVDLLAAMRATVYGPNLGPQNFTYPSELDGHDLERGSLCVLDVTISVPIPRDGSVPGEEVTIETIVGDVRTRGDLLGLETDPVPAPDFDLVVVTNDDPTDD